MDHPNIYIVSKYLRKSGYDVDSNEVTLQLMSHPDFPSILAVSDFFHHIEISHMALRIDKSIEVIEELPIYFLAHIEEIGQPKLVLAERNKKKIRLYLSVDNQRDMDSTEFIKIWSGVIISFSEISKKSFFSKSDIKFSLENLIGLSLSIITIIVFFFSKPDIFQVLFTSLSILGFFVAIVIVRHEFGFNSVSLNKICSLSEKSSCEAVINSEGASFFGILKLSDIGIIYFSSQFFHLIFNSIYSKQIDFSTIVSSYMTIPFAIYSIVYQWRVVKKWCPLCLAIVGVVVLQFGLILFFDLDTSFNTFSINELMSLLLGVLWITCIWLFIKPLMKKVRELRKTEISNLKFKRDYSFFKNSIMRNSVLLPYKNSPHDIILGNPEAQLNFTLVTNPLCYYCKESHVVIEKLLEKFSELISVTLRFNVPHYSLNKSSTGIAYRFLEVNKNHGREKCRIILNEFYSLKNKEKWIDKSQNIIDNELIALLTSHKSWCSENKINFTPALIIDGRLQPKEFYGISDISYFVGNLLEEVNENKLKTLQEC